MKQNIRSFRFGQILYSKTFGDMNSNNDSGSKFAKPISKQKRILLI